MCFAHCLVKNTLCTSYRESQINDPAALQSVHLRLAGQDVQTQSELDESGSSYADRL